MKKLMPFILLAFVLSSTVGSASIARDTLPAVDSANGLRYKVKSKKQATAAIVLTSGGLVMGVVAYGIAMSGMNFPYDPDKDPGDLPEVLGYGALALVVAGLGFLIASKINKRKARVILSRKSPPVPHSTVSTKKQVSAGIVINF